MERQTESRNPRARGVGTMSTRQILELLNDEDATVAAAVRAAIPQIERAVDLIVPALTSGHRLFYVGAGTSGRLGVLDASEMPPTFGVEPELVTGIIAGGDHALRRAADVAIVVEVGPEVIAGSSRMKAGTATKLILNMLSTTSMVKLGRTRDDLMVDLRPTNEKLRQRAIRLVEQEAHVPAEEAKRRLETWGWHVRAAIEDRWPVS